MDPFTPNQAIVPMIVAIILVVLPGFIRLGGVVASTAGAAARRNACCQNRCSHIEVEDDVVHEVNGVARHTCPRETEPFHLPVRWPPRLPC